MSYKDYNDYELLYMVKESDETAYNLLYEKYKPLIHNLSKRYAKIYKNYGIDINDFILEGYVGLEQAILKFKDYDEYKFKSLASVCISRYMQNIVREAKLKKNYVLNNSVYYEKLNEDNEMDYLEIKEDENAINPEREIIAKETLIEAFNECINNLKGLELDVFKLKVNGMTNKEIAIYLNKPLKAINNALNRIRKKYNNL